VPHKFTTPAVVKAVRTLDAMGIALAPENVAHLLEQHLNAVLAQGYEVVSVLELPGAVLCTAVKRTERVRVTEYAPVRFYGCEGLTCRPNAHTLECPNIDQSGR
jgi:hypothetical protein